MHPYVSLFLFTLIDVLGFSIVLPLFPFLAKNFNMTPVEVGLLQSSNALAQLVATPVIGALSDKYGRCPLLILSVFATLVSFLILACAETTFWVFFSRILDGLIGGNISLAHAYVTDITEEKDRSKGMGLIGGAFGLGFVVGPALGGILLKRDHRYPIYLSAGLSFVNLICVCFFLEESLPPSKRKKLVEVNFKDSFANLGKICMTDVRIRSSLYTRFVYMFIFTLFEYSFSFFNIQQLGNDSTMSGYLLCWFGVMYSLSQAVGIRVLRKRFSDVGLLQSCVAILPFLYALLSMCESTKHLFYLLAPLGFASGLLNTLVNSFVSTEIKRIPEIVGGGLGVSSALGSFARIVAPPLAGFLIQIYTPSVPFILCGLMSIFLAFMGSA